MICENGIFNKVFMKIKEKAWGWKIGYWELGIGDWAQSPIPNPQSPIPNPQTPNKFPSKIYYLIKK